jgi:undecaprenol kinase/diacylglycerol kinase (ATP)
MSTFLQNIGFATEGIKYFFKSERNGRIQAVIAFGVLAAGFYFGLSPLEWCLILGCISLVIALEMINTSFERVCAMLSLEFHPIVKIIKDVAAGAVLWSAIFCVIIGAIIFIPHLLLLLNNLKR